MWVDAAFAFRSVRVGAVAGLPCSTKKSCSVETHSGASRRFSVARPPGTLPAAPVLIQDSGFGNQESRNQNQPGLQ